MHFYVIISFLVFSKKAIKNTKWKLNKVKIYLNVLKTGGFLILYPVCKIFSLLNTNWSAPKQLSVRVVWWLCMRPCSETMVSLSDRYSLWIIKNWLMISSTIRLHLTQSVSIIKSEYISISILNILYLRYLTAYIHQIFLICDWFELVYLKIWRIFFTSIIDYLKRSYNHSKQPKILQSQKKKEKNMIQSNIYWDY